MSWFTESNRWKHFVGGILVGAFANSIYCAAYAGIGIAGALEFKDYQWGGKPDIVDFLCTVAGVAVGFGLRTLFIYIVK